MKRVATFAWRTPAPTSVDEELALYDDGSAWLVVRRPMTQTPTIGTFSFSPDRAAFADLVAKGPGPVVFELLAPADAPADVMAAARAVADGARSSPVATATFYARPMGKPTDGQLDVALQVVAAGKRPVEFDLDPSGCAVIFGNRGQPAGWVEMPPLETGFVNADADGLGGLNWRARVDPGGWGSLVANVSVPAPSTAVAVQVAGALYEGLPDQVEGVSFMVRTEDTDIGPLA